MDLGLTNKRVLVTGGYRGTGAGIAASFAAEGATVIVHGFELGDADAVVETIAEARGDARAVAGDLLTEAGADALAETVLADGPVDVLVNNYGVAAGPGWTRTSTPDWLESYERNVLSGVRLAQRLTPAMREQAWGRVVFLSTVGWLRPGPRTPQYYAAKAALGSVAVSLAKELSGTGVTVNTVSPGVIRTAEVEAYFRDRAAKKGWGSDWKDIEPRAIESFMPNPCGRFAEIDEVAAAVVFLASEAAGYVNAVNLRVDGGAADTIV